MDVLSRFKQSSIQSETARFPFGSVVIDQGGSGDAFYIVQAGRLRVIRRNADCLPETLGFLYPGDHFGEGALLTGRGHRASVRAVEDTEVLRVLRDEFVNVLKREPELKAHLQDQVANIAYRNFTRYLKGSVSGDGMRTLFRRIKREEIAKGATVAGPGQSRGRFCAVGSGELEVMSENGGTRRLGAGDFFEETDHSEGGPQVVRSTQDSVLFYLAENDFRDLGDAVAAFGSATSLVRQLQAGENSNASPSRGPRPSEVRAPDAAPSPEGKNRADASGPANGTGSGEWDDARNGAPSSFRYPFLKQHDQSDCGAASLGMICKYYKMPIGLNRLRDMCNVSREGTSMAALAEAAETLGFVTRGVRTGYEALMRTGTAGDSALGRQPFRGVV